LIILAIAISCKINDGSHSVGVAKNQTSLTQPPSSQIEPINSLMPSVIPTVSLSSMSQTSITASSQTKSENEPANSKLFDDMNDSDNPVVYFNKMTGQEKAAFIKAASDENLEKNLDLVL